jgi:uracil phosphoribosyltransferase
MRAGESMELALREVVKDVKIGKILIQSNERNEPEVIIRFISIISSIVR